MAVTSTFFDQGPWGEWAGKAWKAQENRDQQESMAKVAEASARIEEIKAKNEQQREETKLTKRYGNQKAAAEIAGLMAQAKLRNEQADDVDQNRGDIRRNLSLEEGKLREQMDVNDETADINWENIKVDREQIGVQQDKNRVDRETLEVTKRQVTSELYGRLTEAEKAAATKKFQEESIRLDGEKAALAKTASYTENQLRSAQANEAQAKAEEQGLANEYTRQYGMTPKEALAIQSNLEKSMTGAGGTAESRELEIVQMMGQSGIFKAVGGAASSWGATNAQWDPNEGVTGMPADMLAVVNYIKNNLDQRKKEMGMERGKNINTSDAIQALAMEADQELMVYDATTNTRHWIGKNKDGQSWFVQPDLANFRQLFADNDFKNNPAAQHIQDTIAESLVGSAKSAMALDVMLQVFPFLKTYVHGGVIVENFGTAIDMDAQPSFDGQTYLGPGTKEVDKKETKQPRPKLTAKQKQQILNSSKEVSRNLRQVGRSTYTNNLGY
tara:strand:+ start:1823 stop:3319 length:1497 start_codon:yes stop_codon:yes gene_type:complete